MRKETVPKTDEQNIAELKALMSMYHSGNPDLKEEALIRLWDKTKKFVTYAIKKWFPTFVNDEFYFNELTSAAKVAFMDVIKDFDPEKGTLSTFLTLPIKHEMYEWLNDQTHNCSGYHVGMMKKVAEAERELQAQGKEASVAAISSLTGLSVKKVEQALKRIEMDKIASLDGDEQLDETVRGTCKSPEEIYLEKEAQDIIAKALRVLPDLDRMAIILYYGLDGGNPRSYSAVGKQLSISAPMAKESIARGLHILRGDDSLKVMFGRGSQNYRQSQLDLIEISLIPNENIADAYSILDEFEEAKPEPQSSTVYITL